MNAREENKKCMIDIIETMETSLRAMQAECGQMLQHCENLRLGIMVEGQLQRTVKDIMDAPEIVGADENGEGGRAYTPRIDLDE